MPKKQRYRRRQRRSTGLNSKIKKVCAKMIIQKSDPNYEQNFFGTIDSNGSMITAVALNPGQDNGLVTECPQVQIPTDLDQSGQPSYRKDLGIILTGLRVQLRFIQNPAVDYSYHTIYIAQALKTLVAGNYIAPDQRSMIRGTAFYPDLKDRKILWSKTIKIAPAFVNTSLASVVVARVVDKFIKFPNGLKISYDGEHANDYVDKRIQVVIKSSYDDYSAGNTDTHVLVNGSITSYYRDI